MRPLVVFEPPRPAKAKTPAEATETLTENTNFVRRPTKKHVRAVGDPSDHLGPPKKQGPCDYQGPSGYQGPSQLSEASDNQRPL